MKIVKVILFKDDKEFSQFSSAVCENMQSIGSEKEFCGIWGEIQSNENEVMRSISATVNHFIESDKKEIIFGCCDKDCNDILARLNLMSCNIVKVEVKALLK